MKKKAIFFDRDGVINYRIVKDYIKYVEEFHFIPDFLDFLEKTDLDNLLTFVITNQQGVSKGIMTIEQLHVVLDHMQKELREKNIKEFDEIFYCTDLADSGSFFRKPNPGMILDAVEKWNIDINSSWLIGDSPTDSQAGKRVGLKTILIGNYSKTDVPEADYIVKDFYEIKNNIALF